MTDEGTKPSIAVYFPTGSRIVSAYESKHDRELAMNKIKQYMMSVPPKANFAFFEVGGHLINAGFVASIMREDTKDGKNIQSNY